MKEKTTISLEILLLNDLLRTNVIDKEIYDQASKKLYARRENEAFHNENIVLASA